MSTIDAENIAKSQQNCSDPSSTIFEEKQLEGQLILCEISQSIARPYIPKPLRPTIMKTLHGMSHDGVRETVRRISMYYYWNNMKTEITEFCWTCHGCQSQKPTKFKPPNLGHFEVPDCRFSHIHLDIVAQPRSGMVLGRVEFSSSLLLGTFSLFTSRLQHGLREGGILIFFFFLGRLALLF